jgi:hypothetical protein
VSPLTLEEFFVRGQVVSPLTLEEFFVRGQVVSPLTLEEFFVRGQVVSPLTQSLVIRDSVPDLPGFYTPLVSHVTLLTSLSI